MAVDSFVQCRVSSETKTRLRAFASEHELTESALLKRLLEHLLFRPSERVASSSDQHDAPRGERLYVRLNQADRRLLKARADSRKMPEATYVALLLRTTLHRQVPLPKAELTALLQSIAELSSIGRDLRQLICAILAGARTTGYTTENARAMLKVCEALRDHTKSLLKANAASWRQGSEDE